MSKIIVIIAHAPLASALKHCAMHVYACDERTDERVLAVDVEPDADFDAVCASVSSRLGAGGYDDVLVLTGVIGATPANIATSLLKHAGVSVVSGVNLPMLLSALCQFEKPMEEIVPIIRDAAIGNINQNIRGEV